MDEQIAKLQAQQDSCHNRIQEIKNIIESKKDGRKNGSAASQQARARLNELRAASKASLVRTFGKDRSADLYMCSLVAHNEA